MAYFSKMKTLTHIYLTINKSLQDISMPVGTEQNSQIEEVETMCVFSGLRAQSNRT